MSSQTSTLGGLAQFDRTTSIWGPITLGLGFLISLGAALFVAFGTGLGITAAEVWNAFSIVFATFGIIAIVEPISYYPILGRSAMYQAFMIGNIANKLLPSAIIAQSDLGEKPGTRRAELIAGAAIIGAAFVHLLSLVVFVGILGTWLLGLLPPGLISVARLYILAAVFGAVTVQTIIAMKTLRTTIIAGLVAAVVVFGAVHAAPQLTNYATAISVVCAILIAWFARKRDTVQPPAPVSVGH
ncbi:MULTISPECIES: hypothetical protein [unclassified Arthrobacter]|uniref:hypothetical protein n=1 Tax=unclassified Arthrobacter TaxID=235627 RepID=UPI00159D31F3|nr:MULTISPECIES: hypothetical protein [unclassified Arthrobacter]MCQ9163186.1 hypothetical protein [Arthrobacter sp. STN4]NVM98549.1 hypothetical protein [Arthrobacter sp. SDTb3-6]